MTLHYRIFACSDIGLVRYLWSMNSAPLGTQVTDGLTPSALMSLALEKPDKTTAQFIGMRCSILSELAGDLIQTNLPTQIKDALLLFAGEFGSIAGEVLRLDAASSKSRPRQKKTTYTLEVGNSVGGFRTEIEARNPKEAKALALAEAHPWVDTSQPLTVDWLEKITRL
jgi:hypothetical protein